MLFPYLSIAQSGLGIIDYNEAARVISRRKLPVIDTPVIAIIDKGVNILHEDLVTIIWTNNYEIPGNGIDDDENGFIDDYYGWNFENDTNDVGIDGVGNWHGTPINGIIGADHTNTLGINGISPNVKLMNIVKGESIESIKKALFYIYSMRKVYNETNGANGAYVVGVNCSWGKDALRAEDYPAWCALYDSLGSVGVLTISSVPNANIDVDLFGDMPTTCTSDFLITVTNSDRHDAKIVDAAYGQYSVDLAAPGDNTYTTFNPGGYGYFGGTSAAAPYVAGLVGLLYLLPSDAFQQSVRRNPSQSALTIKSVILEGVTPLPDFKNTTTSGGRLNAYSAVKLLSDIFGEQELYFDLFESLKIITIHPNPAFQQTSLVVENSTDSNLDVRMVDLEGTTVYVNNATVEKGFSTIPIDLQGISSGLYIVKVSSSQITKTAKLLIK